MDGLILWLLDVYPGILVVMFLTGVVLACCGVLRLTPEFKHDVDTGDTPEEERKFNRNSIIMLFVGVGLIALTILLPSRPVLMYLFGLDQYSTYRLLNPKTYGF